MNEKEKNKSKVLGQDPFEASFKWIENTSSTKKEKEIKSEIQELSLPSKLSKHVTDNTIRQTYHLNKDVIEKIKKYSYIERLKISEVVNVALKEFFITKKFD